MLPIEPQEPHYKHWMKITAPTCIYRSVVHVKNQMISLTRR